MDLFLGVLFYGATASYALGWGTRVRKTMSRIFDTLYILGIKAYIYLLCRREGWKIVYLDVELLPKDEKVDA